MEGLYISNVLFLKEGLKLIDKDFESTRNGQEDRRFLRS